MFSLPSLCPRLRRPAVFLVTAIALNAQQTQQATPTFPAPTIRVTTHMVLVDAVITDKQGKPITGLKADDFVIEENGKVQKIARVTSAAENMPSAGQPLPLGIYSNEAQYRSPGTPITVMLLDAMNTPFTDQAYARRQKRDQYNSEVCGRRRRNRRNARYRQRFIRRARSMIVIAIHAVIFLSSGTDITVRTSRRSGSIVIEGAVR